MCTECVGVSSDNLIFSWYLLRLSIYISLSLQTARETRTRGMFYDITAKFVFILWYIAHQLLGTVKLNLKSTWNEKDWKRLIKRKGRTWNFFKNEETTAIAPRSMVENKDLNQLIRCSLMIFSPKSFQRKINAWGSGEIVI